MGPWVWLARITKYFLNKLCNKKKQKINTNLLHTFIYLFDDIYGQPFRDYSFIALFEYLTDFNLTDCMQQAAVA